MEKKLVKLNQIIMLILITACVTAIGIRIFDFKTEKSIEERINQKVLEIMENSPLNEKLNMKLQIIQEYLDTYYIDKIDEKDKDKCIESAIKGYVNGLGDDYTQYLTKEDYEELLIEVNGNYSGIGIVMGQDKNGNVIILGIMKNSPAEKSDIKTGDIVVEVDGQNCISEDLNIVSNKIKGEIGTKVKIKLLRENETIEKTVVREKIEINAIESEMLEENIGYIQILSFDEKTIEDFNTNYEKLLKARSKIIDNRFKKQWTVV